MQKRPFPAYKGDDPYIFVSYAHKNAESVYPLLVSLRERGVNIWYDEGIEPGSKWREELSNAIGGAEKFLFVASKASVASPNCEREVDYALSLNIPVQVCYIEEVKLPPHLGFSLGSHQAVSASHYEPEEFQAKVYDALVAGPEKLLGKIAVVGRRKAGVWALVAAIVLAPIIFIVASRFGAPDEIQREPIEIRPSIEDPVQIAIRPLKNVTGNEDLNWLGDGLSNLLRADLSASRFAVVTSSASWMQIENDAADDAAIFESAKRLGADYLISGEILNSGDDLLTTLRVTNLRAGIDVMTQTYPDLSPSALVEASSRIAVNVKQAIKIPRESELQSLSADFYTENIAAYEAYVNGLSDYNRFAYEEAESDLRVALTLSPNFHVARYRLADILDATGRRDLAREELAKIPEDAALDAREALYVQGLRQTVEDDLEGAIKTYSEILEKFPYEIEAQQLLSQNLFNDYQEERSVAALKELRVQEPKNPHVLGALGYQLTSVNKLEEAREVLAEYLTLFPDQSNAWELAGSLKLREGDIAGAIGDYQKALALEDNFTAAKIGLAKAQALSGNLDEAGDLFAGIAEDDDLSTRYRIDAAFDLAYVRRAQNQPGNVRSSLEPLVEQIRSEALRMGLYWYVLSQAEADAGDMEKAREYLQNAFRDAPNQGVPTRFLHLRGLYDVREGQSIDDEVEELQEYRLPDDDPDRTEDKAIHHLRGLAALARGDARSAVQMLQQAVDLGGYEYGIYAVDLARALVAAGRSRDAKNVIAEVEAKYGSELSAEVRLDLLWHRQHAAQLKEEIK